MEQTNFTDTYNSFIFDWEVKAIPYRIEYKIAYPVTEVDEILCQILDNLGGHVRKIDLGILLGFNIIESTESHQYVDLAEAEIFNYYLKELFDFNLATLNNGIVNLTSDGCNALITGLKYEYHKVETHLFENVGFPETPVVFSFNQLGLKTSLKTCKDTAKDCSDPYIKDVLNHQIFENNIYSGNVIAAEKLSIGQQYHKINLECRFTIHDGQPALSFYFNDTAIQSISETLNLPSNKDFKNRLDRRSLFEALKVNLNHQITSHQIEEYIDLWDLNELAQDNRVNWSDELIFKIYDIKGDGSIWQTLSKYVPIEHIKLQLEVYKEKWDWTVLSDRLEIGFICQNIKAYPWNYVLLSKNDPNLVYLFVSDNECIEFDWDWSTITLHSSDLDVIEYIGLLPYDFHLLTEQRGELTKKLVIDQSLVSRSWNWSYITENFDLEFLLQHISHFSDYIKWVALIDRVFSDKNYKFVYLNDSDFRHNIKAQVDKQLQYFFISQQDYLWDYDTIQFFDDLGLIKWNDTNYDKGFESNNSIRWNKILFNSFKHRIKSQLGIDVVSHSITDLEVISDTTFTWNWDVLSKNKLLINNLLFLKSYAANLNWSIVIPKLDCELLESAFTEIVLLAQKSSIDKEQLWIDITRATSEEFIYDYFLEYPWDCCVLSDKSTEFLEKTFAIYQPFNKPFKWIKLISELNVDVWENGINILNEKLNVGEVEQLQIWQSLSKKVNYEIVRANPFLPWDWISLTKLVIDKIKVNKLNDERFVDKWDWVFISRNFSKAQIIDGLNHVESHWDWEYLLRNVFTLEDIHHDQELGAKIIHCVNTTSQEIQKKCWCLITKMYPIDILYKQINETIYDVSYQWDWDTISLNEHFSLDVSTITRFKAKWNWSLLPLNSSIKKIFDYHEWENKESYYKNAFKYLEYFRFKWDWSVLSQNKHLTRSTKFISKFRNEAWDWDYLSEFGGLFATKTEEKLILLLRTYKESINWRRFSYRTDLRFTESLLVKFEKQDWDWEQLSKSKHLNITAEFILNQSSKPWDWVSISNRIDIQLNNQLLIDLENKEWDWKHLSKRKDLSFTEDFIVKLADKSWDWHEISRNHSFTPSIQTLELIAEKGLDWEYISKRKDINYSYDILARFQSYLNWDHITRHHSIDFLDIRTLAKFESKWDWTYISLNIDSNFDAKWFDSFKDHLVWDEISQNSNLRLDEDFLAKFKSYLNWKYISSNTSINFTNSLVDKFENFWNWDRLLLNPAAREKLGEYISLKIDSSPTLKFLSRIDKQNSKWKGHIYHFAHIDNAVKIIKSGKIQSRNSGAQLSDAAGNVVNRRDDAHHFARFYFRPQTPTQFYNQYLGKDKTSYYVTRRPDHFGNWNDVKVFYYDKARNLGFPKCPVPVFFRFSLREVLTKKYNACYMSNGNMQTNRAKFGKFESMVNMLNYDKLYMSFNPKDWEDYLNYSQQEFLIEKELAFEDLESLEIICACEADKNLLLRLLNDDSAYINKINVDDGLSIFHHDNPRVDITETEDKLIAKTSYEGEGIIKISSSAAMQLSSILGGNIIKASSTEIIFKNEIQLLKPESKVTFTFVDESGREWFIYKN